MKKLLIAVLALAALSLLAPSSGFAQDDFVNRMGIYVVDNGIYVPTTDVAAPYTTVSAYLVLVNPEQDGTPIEGVGGFECTVSGEGTYIVTAWNFSNPQALNVATAPSFSVGFGSPSAVTDGFCELIQMDVLYSTLDGSPVYLFLNPFEPASIEGYMAIINSGSEDLVAISPSSGDFAEAVFAINGEVVATEDSTLDMIKTMYR